MKVLAIIVSNEGNGVSYQSLLRQTVPPSRIIIASDKGIVNALNNVLARVNIWDYDYIFRTNHDVYFPPNWMEKNLALGVDLIGSHGDAMLIRPKVIDGIGGKFFYNVVEDSYFVYMAVLNGFSYKREVVAHANTRKMASTANPWRFIDEGVAMWQIGYGPLHLAWNTINATVRHRNFRFLVKVPCYFYAAITDKPKWPTSKVIKFGQVSTRIKRR